MLTEKAFDAAVRTAVRAPSLHNSQPWQFSRTDDVIEVRADLDRWLPGLDPQGRELLISCGGAVRHLVLGLRAQGLHVDWALLPSSDDEQLVARVTVLGRRPATLLDAELLTATQLRHTDRSPFGPDRVNPNVVQRLRCIAELEGCFLDELDEDDALRLAVLTDHADRVLDADAGLRHESQQWVRGEAAPVDGLPAGALPQQGAHRGSPVPLRRFGAAPRVPVPGDEPPVAEHPTLLVLGSAGDARSDWLACGWVLSDLLLTMTCEGVVGSPLTQPLELSAYRARLRTELGLQGHPQMVLRVGYPAGLGSPPTGRRAVADVIR